MYRYFKRGFDIVFATILILVLLPVTLPIMIILRLTAEGEVFYRQERVGYKNRIFYIWKFATMLKNSPNMGTKDITLRNDPRVTAIGGFLRRTKLNELPQLINILIGDMSFVGPRPLMIRGFEDFPERFKDKVYNVVPGLTGAGSVIFRDEELVLTKSELPPRETYRTIIQPHKAELEIWYQKNQSLYTDFLLMFLTIWVLLFPNTTLPHRVFSDLPAQNGEMARLLELKPIKVPVG